MISCLSRLLLIFCTIVSSTLVFSLCGCARVNGFVMNESGQSYYRNGYYAQAKQEFQKALLDDPLNPHYAYNLAAATHKQGDFATADQLYRHTLNLDPSHQPAYHGMASLMLEQGRAEEAEQLLTAWAGSQPYLAEPHVELAWLQRTNGDPAAAEESLRQALQINPSHERAIAQLGQVFEEQGRTGEATAMYQRSLYVNGNQPAVRSRMASLQERMPAHNSGTFANPAVMAEIPYDTFNAYGQSQMASAQPGYPASPPVMTQYGPTDGMPQVPPYSTANPFDQAIPLSQAMPPQYQQFEGQSMYNGTPPAGAAVPLAGPARMAPISAAARSTPQGFFPAASFDSASSAEMYESNPSVGVLPPLPQLTQALPAVEAF